MGGGQVRPHNGRIPVIEYLRVDIGDDERSETIRLAERLKEDDPQLAARDVVDPNVACGLGDGPGLLIEDHSWITLFELRGNRGYSYRALLLAGDGDVVIVGTRRHPEFERYCRETLKLGEVQVLSPRPARRADSLGLRTVKDAGVLQALVTRARSHRGMNVIPYMGTGGVWRLAAAIAQQAGVPVRVAAPAPSLTRCVNDKIWFTRRVHELFGVESHPPTRAAFGSAMLAARVAQAAQRYPDVAVKLTASAAGEGNFVLHSEELRGLSLRQVRRRLLERLEASGWRGAYPVLVSAWEGPVAISPSVQLWIPQLSAGPPIVEGLFEQRLAGSHGQRFAGANPTGLPMGWQRRLAGEGVRIGLLFQCLGYFGRLSLDAIIVGRDLAHGQLHWIECNGRWGGVSIPMTLANRLTGDWRRHPFVIEEHYGLHLPPAPLASTLGRLSDLLFVAGETDSGAVVLSVDALERGTGFEIMAIAGSVEAAAQRAASFTAALDVAAQRES